MLLEKKKKKKQSKGKPTSPQCKDVDMNSPIVCISHPQSWCLLSLKLYQFPKITWNTPTPGAFDKQSSSYREKHFLCVHACVRVCVCVCVCVCVLEVERQRKTSWGRWRKWQYSCELHPRHLRRPEGLYCNLEESQWVRGFPPWISLLRL